MVVALAVLSLVIIGITLSSGRGADGARLGLEGLQAQYTVEGGANMAIREIYVNADEDGDGVIGTISNDGNAANNPAIGVGKVSVTKSTSGATITLTALSTTTTTSRQVQVALTTGATSTAFVSQGTSKNVYESILTGGAWPAPAVSGAVFDVPCWISAVPFNGKNLVAAMDISARLHVGLANSAGVAAYTQVCSDVYGIGTRSFDVGVDTFNDKAIVAYWDQPSLTMKYRTHNGTTLSGATTVPGMTFSAGDEAQVVSLVSRGSGVNVLLLVLTQGQKLWAATWNGSAWTGATTLSTAISVANYNPFAAAYEALSGDILLIYGDSTGNAKYRTYTGSWSAEGSFGALGANVQWIRMVPRAGTDEIYMAASETAQNLYLAKWSGSALTAFVVAASAIGYTDRRPFDIRCSADGSTVLAAYGVNANTLYYRTWTGAAFSAQLSGPNLGAKVQIVQLTPGAAAADVLCGVSTAAPKIWSTNFSAGAFSTALGVQSSPGGTDDHERFAFLGGNVTETVSSWTQLAPP